jgi:hypothetical protein
MWKWSKLSRLKPFYTYINSLFSLRYQHYAHYLEYIYIINWNMFQSQYGKKLHCLSAGNMNNPNYSQPSYADPNTMYDTPAEPGGQEGKYTTTHTHTYYFPRGASNP